VKSLAYDCITRVGVLRMAAGDCCDMQGCVRLFERIAPEVRAVHTFSGDVLDTCYRKRGGVWQVIPPPPEADEGGGTHG
jgi:hypothetical protein